MSSIVSNNRTVAAATGRGFESRRPDFNPVVFYVYVLRSSKTRRRYIGSCEDLHERIRRHNLGHSKATRHGVPWILEYSESFATRAEAAARERFFKTGRGRDELDSFEQ